MNRYGATTKVDDGMGKFALIALINAAMWIVIAWLVTEAAIEIAGIIWN